PLLPVPERVAEAEVPSVGKKPDRADCSKACAWRYCASACTILRLAHCRLSIKPLKTGSLNNCHQSPRNAASLGWASTHPGAALASCAIRLPARPVLLASL